MLFRSNQAIYGSLGGVAKSLEEISNLFETNFKEMHLTGCYRSNQSIIDYYSKFAVEGIKINSMRQNSAEIGTIRLNKKVNKGELAECIMNIVNDILGKGVKEEDICIVASRWELIFSLTNKLRKLLPSVRFDAPEITPFKFDAMNPFYLLAKLSFMNQKGHEKARKRYANEIINILKNDYEININERYDCYNLLEAINSVELFLNADGIECYIEIVAKVMNSLKICLQSEKTLNNCYEQFIRKSKDRIKNHNLSVSCEDLRKCFEEKNGIVINTIHGIKGEEYNSVIAFGLLRDRKSVV